MIPGIGRLMRRPDLINGIRALANTVTAEEVVILDDVQDGHTHPDPFFVRLLQDLDVHLRVLFAQRALQKVYWVAA